MELVRLPVDILIAPGMPEAVAARKATTPIPIVMAGWMTLSSSGSSTAWHGRAGILPE